MTQTRFHCTICGAGLSVGLESAGRVIECPGCRHVVPVPGTLPRVPGPVDCLAALPPEVLALDLKFLCPECSAKLRIDARLEGESVDCPKCTTAIRVPRWSQAPARARPRASERTTAALSAAEIEFLSSPQEMSGAHTAVG